LEKALENKTVPTDTLHCSTHRFFTALLISSYRWCLFILLTSDPNLIPSFQGVFVHFLLISSYTNFYWGFLSPM